MIHWITVSPRTGCKTREKPDVCWTTTVVKVEKKQKSGFKVTECFKSFKDGYNVFERKET